MAHHGYVAMLPGHSPSAMGLHSTHLSGLDLRLTQGSYDHRLL